MIKIFAIVSLLLAVALTSVCLPRVSGQILLGGSCDNDDTWKPLGVPSISPPTDPGRILLWTGGSFIVWSPTGPGYSFNTGEGVWKSMTAAGQPLGQMSWDVAVWTGNLMLVYGATLSLGQYTSTAAAYYPLNDIWSADNASGPVGANHAAIWTGIHMIVWSGTSGGRYDPGLDEWLPMNPNGAPNISPVKPVNMVWTGTEAIVFGFQSQQGSFVPVAGRYNPTTDAWLPVSTHNAPRGTDGPQSVWTGSKMIVWTNDGDSAEYDPATDTWDALPPPDAAALTAETVVWTGHELLVWGQPSTSRGARYNPVTRTWTSITTANAPVPGNYLGLWSGDFLFVLGASTGSSGQPSVITGGFYCAKASQAPGCSYSLNPTGHSFGEGGGMGSFVATASAETCARTPATNAPWITVLDGNGTGTGTVDYKVAINTTANPRTGTISVSGQDFTITQAGGPAISGVSPDGRNLIVTGTNFDTGSMVLVNGNPVSKTIHDPQNPNTLVGKKGAKLIPHGHSAPIQVQNSDGVKSLPFVFMRP